jgi:single-stranded DNA-binding protein
VKKRREKNIEEVGELIADPVLTNTGAGRTVCDMKALLFNEQYQPFIIALTTFDGVAEDCAADLKKGDEVEIDGKLRFRRWMEGRHFREGFSILARRVERVGSDDGSVARPAPAPPGQEPGDSEKAPDPARALDHEEQPGGDESREEQLAVVGGGSRRGRYGDPDADV